MEKVNSRNRANARIARRLLRPSRSSLLHLATLHAIYRLNALQTDDKLTLRNKRLRGPSSSQRTNLKVFQPSTQRRIRNYGSRTSMNEALLSEFKGPKRLFETNTLQPRSRHLQVKSQNEGGLSHLTARQRVPPLDLGLPKSSTFQEEFLTKAEEFSQSWREAIGR